MFQEAPLRGCVLGVLLYVFVVTMGLCLSLLFGCSSLLSSSCNLGPLWVVLGSIFIGAVHDFGALVVSLRNRGQTVGEVAGRLISPRARVLFLLVLFFSLTIVLAIFGLVIASIFQIYPESVLSVWIAMPLAMGCTPPPAT